jgi:DNA-binding IclR family transcriptional regulator
LPHQPKNFSKSAHRALDVLGFFSIAQRPARACEIGDALGIARSSTDQLLKTMVIAGYLVLHTQDKTYFPSLRLAGFGTWIAGCYPEARAFCDIVTEVRDHTEAIVSITMENDCYMQMMEYAYEREAPECSAEVHATIDATLQVGARVPVLRSAVGAAALMIKTRPEIRRLVHRARYHGTGATAAVELSRLMDDLGQDLSRGYSSRATRMPVEQREPRYWSVAVPFPARDRRATIVLGLTGATDRVCGEEGRLAEIMRRSIERRLSA